VNTENVITEVAILCTHAIWLTHSQSQYTGIQLSTLYGVAQYHSTPHKTSIPQDLYWKKN